jgi:hypothetical protein
MYYLLMLLACFERQIKTPKSIEPAALLSPDCEFGSGFQSLIFKSEMGFF